MRVLLLLSGGIDSPVAGHLLQRLGATVGAVHFSLEPFTDDAPERKSRELAERLGFRPFYAVPAGDAFAEVAKRAGHRYYFVLSKRLMVRAAEQLALREGFDALATGEALGQVSSQTLPHLGAIQRAAAMPVLRPLLGHDKTEITAIAERIGTFELSKGPEVCDVLGPDHPATAATVERIEAEEARLDVEGLVERLVSVAAPSVRIR